MVGANLRAQGRCRKATGEAGTKTQGADNDVQEGNCMIYHGDRLDSGPRIDQLFPGLLTEAEADASCIISLAFDVCSGGAFEVLS